MEDYKESYRKIFIESSNNLEEALHYCFTYKLHEFGVRPLIWKIFLDLLPLPDAGFKNWVETLVKQRTTYKKKLNKYLAVKKLVGDPLGGAIKAKKDKEAAKWDGFYDDQEIKKMINLDVNRTYQEFDDFHMNEVKDALSNVLFIWSKENMEICYKQGMNEIIGQLYLSLVSHYKKQEIKIEAEELVKLSGEINDQFLDKLHDFIFDYSYLQCDLYYFFCELMKRGVKELYDNGPVEKDKIGKHENQKEALLESKINQKTKDLFQLAWEYEEKAVQIDIPESEQLPLLKRCLVISTEYLKKVDSTLFSHLKNIELNCVIFLQRWIKCLLTREYTHEETMIIWDITFAIEYLITSSKKDEKDIKHFDFLDFICLAMIKLIKEKLMVKDQNECYQMFFKYPPISVNTVVNQALLLRNKVFNINEEYFGSLGGSGQKSDSKLSVSNKDKIANQTKLGVNKQTFPTSSLEEKLTSQYAAQGKSEKSSDLRKEPVLNPLASNKFPTSDFTPIKKESFPMSFPKTNFSSSKIKADTTNGEKTAESVPQGVAIGLGIEEKEEKRENNFPKQFTTSYQDKGIEEVNSFKQKVKDPLGISFFNKPKANNTSNNSNIKQEVPQAKNEKMPLQSVKSPKKDIPEPIKINWNTEKFNFEILRKEESEDFNEEEIDFEENPTFIMKNLDCLYSTYNTKMSGKDRIMFSKIIGFLRRNCEEQQG